MWILGIGQRAVTDAIGAQPKYQEAVRKMNGDGFNWTKFLPGLLADKEEMFRILRTRGIQRPVLQIWSNRDPTVSESQAMALYRILAEKERRARCSPPPRKRNGASSP